MRCRSLVAAAVLLVASGVARPAFAGAVELRIVRPLDLVALPLLIMEHDHLIDALRYYFVNRQSGDSETRRY